MTGSTVGGALLAHPGTQYSHQLAKQLFRHGLLNEFWTGFALAENSLTAKVADACLPARLRKKLANRVLADVDPDLVKTMPLTEFKALIQARNGGENAALHIRNRDFQKCIPQLSLKKASVVIGFDTSSWILADRVRKMDKPFLLDQSIAHPAVNESTARTLSREFPDWQITMEQKSAKEFNCEKMEHEFATKVIAASSFTKRTLTDNGVPAEKIVVNPYGVNLELFHPPQQRREGDTVRFLFVGSLSARKGVPLLLKAWQALNLKNSELWLVGPVSESQRSLIPESESIKIKGKYPLKELPELMRQCDVMVFPSYCEGFALVLLEALATGLPIITTEATAGPDLIESGTEGFLLHSGDLNALSDSVKYFANDRARLEKMSRAARMCAERFSWDSYGDRWDRILQGLN